MEAALEAVAEEEIAHLTVVFSTLQVEVLQIVTMVAIKPKLGVVALAVAAVMDMKILFKRAVALKAVVVVEFCLELVVIILTFMLQIAAKTGQVILMVILQPQVTLRQVVQGVVLVTTQDTVAHCITAVVAVAAGGLVVALVDTEAVALAAKQLRTTDIAIV